MLEIAEMEVENEENKTSDDEMTAQENAPAENIVNSTDVFSSELNEPRWSVITYESVAVSGLTYAEAEEWIEKLNAQNISGLCIVTDEAARRTTS